MHKHRKEDLTREELRAYPGLENITDEHATHIIASLKELSLLVCNATDKIRYNKTNIIDNQRNMCILADKKAA